MRSHRGAAAHAETVAAPNRLQGLCELAADGGPHRLVRVRRHAGCVGGGQDVERHHARPRAGRTPGSARLLLANISILRWRQTSCRGNEPCGVPSVATHRCEPRLACLLCWTSSSRDLRCMSLNMFRKPLLREGVSACVSPSMSMKDGSIRTISSGVHPLRPLTSKAARPFVSCESESAAHCTRPSASTRGTTHTWDTHPCTLFCACRDGGRGLPDDDEIEKREAISMNQQRG